ncbi:MAG: ComEC/Rec2 family competence protein, partial [Phycisphaerae bacterium]
TASADFDFTVTGAPCNETADFTATVNSDENVAPLPGAISLPLVLFHFSRFAPWGALQSVVVSPLVIVTIIVGFFTLIAQAVLPPVGAGLGFLLRGATDLLLWAVQRLSQLPGTLREVQPPPPAVLVIATYALFLLLVVWLSRVWRTRPQVEDVAKGARHARWLGGRARRGLLLSGAIPFLWLLWLVQAPADTGRDYAIHVLSVGSGSATLITTPDRRAASFDTGTTHNFDAGETAVRAARALGLRRLDALVISHANFDHYSGAATLLQELPTERLLFNPYFETSAADSSAVRQLLDSLASASPPRSTLRSGDGFMLGAASIEVLWPPDDLDESWRPNDRSLVLRIRVKGRSVMVTGDIERAAIRELLDLHEAGQIDLSSDVLIAPHHGAVLPADTAAFYEAVAPQVIISSTARERPKLTALVRETLGETVRLLSTHGAGAVTVRLSPEGQIKVETPFAAQPR